MTKIYYSTRKGFEQNAQFLSKDELQALKEKLGDEKFEEMWEAAKPTLDDSGQQKYFMGTDPIGETSTVHMMSKAGVRTYFASSIVEMGPIHKTTPLEKHMCVKTPNWVGITGFLIGVLATIGAWAMFLYGLLKMTQFLTGKVDASLLGVFYGLLIILVFMFTPVVVYGIFSEGAESLWRRNRKREFKKR